MATIVIDTYFWVLFLLGYISIEVICARIVCTNCNIFLSFMASINFSASVAIDIIAVVKIVINLCPVVMSPLYEGLICRFRWNIARQESQDVGHSSQDLGQRVAGDQTE